MLALTNLGVFLCDVGDFQAARAYLAQGYQLAREYAADRSAEAYNLHAQGQLAWTEGDTARAAALWREATAIREAIGEPHRAQASRARLVEALTVLGQAAEAPALADRAWSYWQAQPPAGEESQDVRAGALALARSFTRLGRPDDAHACLLLAHRLVQAGAQHIADLAARQTFLSAVTVNREIEAALADMSRSRP
jgi:hypothetical protein